MYYDVRVHEVRLPPASCSGSNRALTDRRPLHPHHYLMQPSSLQEVSACGLRGGGGGLTTKEAFFVAIVVHVYLHALARAVLPGLRGPTWARWARALAPGGIALVGVALAASFALEPDLAKVRRLRVSLTANLTKADRRGPGAIRRCVPRIVKCSDSRTGSRRCSGRPSLSWALSTSPVFSSSSRPPGRKGGSGRGPTPGSVERVRGEFTAAPPVHAASSDNESSSLHGPRKCHDSPSASAPVQHMVPPPSPLPHSHYFACQLT